MTVDALLAPVAEQIRAAGEEIAKQVEITRRIDASGLPPERSAFTVSQVAKHLQVAPETVREWFYSAQLQGLQTGNRILIWRWSLLEFMGMPTGPAKGKRQERRSRALQGS